jgi:hypothetical protein
LAKVASVAVPTVSRLTMVFGLIRGSNLAWGRWLDSDGVPGLFVTQVG